MNRWFVRCCRRALATVLALSLSACALLPAAKPAPPTAAPLLHDALFDHPPRPPEADGVFELDEAMRQFLRAKLVGASQQKGSPRALIAALYGQGELRLRYDATTTRNAAQAFADRSGNCLSLVIMTAAFARELGLEISFQSARQGDAFSRQGNLTLRSGHVNLVLGPRRTMGAWQSALGGNEPNGLQVDFLPPDELRGLRTVPITEATVLAMFMNNRATEALVRQRPAEAYAWAREALRHDAGFTAALNTLGVVYQRAGHLMAAVAAFDRVLALDSGHTAAMWNLAQALQNQGRFDEAQAWNQRRLALEPVAPFLSLQQGQAAMARGAYAEARALFDREQQATGPSAELYFWQAQAFFALGQWRAAQQALQQAASSSPGGAQQALYEGKLAWLRAKSSP